MCTSRGVDRIRKKKNQTHNCGAPHPAGLVLRDLHAIPPHKSLFRAASALLRGQHKICTKNIPRSRPGPAMFDRHRLTIDSLHETKPAGRTRNATQPNPTLPHAHAASPTPTACVYSFIDTEKREISFSVPCATCQPWPLASLTGWLVGGRRQTSHLSQRLVLFLVNQENIIPDSLLTQLTSPSTFNPAYESEHF
jgi:hypothetical protein